MTAARTCFANLKFVNLDEKETFPALEKASALKVAGKTIHDYLHIAAAEKAKCETVVTLNERHFRPLAKLHVISPPEAFAT